MTIRDLLPLLPKYSDNSGYSVKVNFISIVSIWKDTKSNKKCNKYYADVFLSTIEDNEKFKRMLDCEVTKITSGKNLVGGDYDDLLQLWLDTEEFAEIRDRTK